MRRLLGLSKGSARGAAFTGIAVRQALLSAAGICAFAALLANPTTAAAAGCPNEAFRIGLSAQLPDCRAYEQVTPVEKNGAGFGVGGETSTPHHLSPDGSAANWQVLGNYPGTEVNNGVANDYVAARGATGWLSPRSFTPAPEPTGIPSGASVSTVARWSADLSKAVLEQGTDSAIPGKAPKGIRRALYLREGVGEPLIWITEPTIQAPTGEPEFSIAGVSADLSRIVFYARSTVEGQPVRLVPADSGRTSGGGVYEFTQGQLRLVSILPDDSVPPAGATAPEPNPIASAFAQGNQVSSDGSRVVFAADAPGAPGSNVYMRLDRTSTVLISKSMITGEPAESATFNYASPDGSKVWFTSTDALASGATSGSPNLYVYDVASQSVTYLSAIGVPLGLSADGSTFLYVKPGTFQLWVSDHGSQREIGELDLFTALIRGEAEVAATATGSEFVFTTRSAIGEGEFNNGFGVKQVYVYDPAADQLFCASCPPAGVSASGDARATPNQNYRQPIRGMSSDGSRVFFQTPTPLVDRDRNGQGDVYEWTRAGVALISSGSGIFPAFLADNSVDGNSVTVVTRNRLTATDEDEELDIFDARVDGGFPAARPLPPPCEFACQNVAAPQGQRAEPGSLTFQGPPNRKAKRAVCRRARAGRHGKRRRPARHGKCVRRKKASKHSRGGKHRKTKGRSPKAASGGQGR